MKTKTYILRVILVGIVLLIILNCKKDSALIATGPIIFNPSLTYGTVTDAEGNVYKTVQIGTQTWMVENLKTTKYLNGDPIPNVVDNTQWENLSTGAYCTYDNNSSRISNYGHLYNWFAVSDNRRIAPNGWHVATDAEWTILYNYLGNSNVAGNKLKETGTTHWYAYNSEATNESGFTALPGGNRNNMTFAGLTKIYQYSDLGNNGYWWCSTESELTAAPIRSFAFDNSIIRILFLKNFGCSVRCVKD